MAEQRFDFLRELVKNVPDISLAEEAACNYTEDDVQSSPEQDSLSDAASEYTKSSNITDFSEITTTASSAMIQIDTPLDMRKNGLNVDNENNDLANTNNETIRCTRNVKYYQQQPLHRSHHESDRVNKFSTLKASSVIMHTNSVKLLRAESAPDAQTIRGGGGYGSAKRSRHHKIAATCTGESASSSVSTTDSAAAAPVLNFDFSSNPLVQINCSNIQTTNVTKDEDGVVGGNVMKSSLAHSTPAVASTFDLSHTSTPNISINIDLSSININATNKKPAAVTITTVDDNSNNEPQAAIYSNIINTSIPNIAIMPKAINTSTSTTSMSATNENTLLELDEDYDNI